jgi:hypothetical protein
MTTMRRDQPATDLVHLAPDELTDGPPWVVCPEPQCHATAEVIDRYSLRSTDGPVWMVRTRCLGKHIRDWIDDTG